MQEKIRKGSWKKGLLVMIAVLFLGLLAEWTLQYPVWSLPAQEQGVTELALAEITIDSGFSCEEERLIAEEGTQRLTISLGGRYVDKLTYSYEAFGRVNATLKVSYYNAYGELATETISDWNSAAISSSTVNIRQRVESITITFTVLELEDEALVITDTYRGEPLTITGISICNVAGLKGKRLLFFWAFFGVAAILIWFRGQLAARVELAFLLIGLTVGSLVVLFLPAVKVSWDEEMHFKYAYEVSNLPGSSALDGVLNNFIHVSETTWPYNLPASEEELLELESFFDENSTCLSGEGDQIHVAEAGKNVMSAYLGSSLLIKLTRKLGCSFTTVYRAGRLGNLLVYLLLMTLAIRLIPIGKRILAMLGLMPTPLFLASVYSYDMAVIAGCVLITAVAVREYLTPKERLSLPKLALATVAGGIGILCKAVYAPLFLLFLALPAEKFKDRRIIWGLRIGVCLLALAFIASFVLPVLFVDGYMSDSRGGDTNTSLQLAYVLGQPLAYARVLLANIWESLPDYLAGTSVFGLAGHLGSFSLSSWLYLVATGVVVTDSYRDKRLLPAPEEGRIDVARRLWMLLLCLGTVALVWTALYLAYTEVGSTTIAGVQGRYMLPLLLPLYLALRPSRLQNQMSEAGYTLLVMLMMLAILFLWMWEIIVTVFVF